MLPITVPDQRIMRGQSATLRWYSLDEDGDLAVAGGAVTVGITQADGTVVVAAGAATTNPSTGVYEYALAAASNLTLELLTVTWSVATVGAMFTTLVEVCGGFVCTIAELRAAETTLADATKYPAATLQRARLEAEAELEWITAVAFVPRYRRITVDGDGSPVLVLVDHEIRSVRSIRSYTDHETYTSFTADELAALRRLDSSIERTDGDVFDLGVGNIVGEYEHGYDRPPADLKRQFQSRCRWWANQVRSAIPDRATSFTYSELGGRSGTFQLDQASPFKTGMSDVDAAYGRYSRRPQAGASVPVSKPLNVDPSRTSLFHGGRR